MNLLQKITVVTAGVTLAVATGIPAFAVGEAGSHANAHALGRPADAGSQANTASATANRPSDPGSQTDSQTGDSRASTMLSNAKLHACQNREKAIDNIMARIADRGQKQLDLFTTIATRIQSFYTSKGKTLSNYDSLVADVNAKAAAAQTTVNSVKSDSANFKCDGTDPQGAASVFKSDLTSEIAALKAYRTSVKDLIVGVKSVEGTTASTDNTNSGSANTGGQQ